MVKRLLIIIIVLLTAYSAQSTTPKYLVVETSSGDLYSFNLSDDPVITFENQMMKIKSISNSYSFEISSVKEYSFSDTDVTGIGNVQTNRLRISNDADDQIIIEGIHSNSKLKIFSVDGKEWKGNISIIDEKAFLDLHSLPKGIYIITVNNNSFKIHKK